MDLDALLTARVRRTSPGPALAGRAGTLVLDAGMAGQWTVMIAGGRVTARRGPHAAPTTTVRGTTDVLARRVPTLTAVEIDADLAARLTARFAGTNVTIDNADATALPYADGTFTAAVCFTMLHHVPSLELQDRLMERRSPLPIVFITGHGDVPMAVTTMKKGAILASNTSTLDLNKIASFTKRPGDVVGLHFFSPANVMKLLEVVRGDKTGKDVLATVMSLAKKIKRDWKARQG